MIEMALVFQPVVGENQILLGQRMSGRHHFECDLGAGFSEQQRQIAALQIAKIRGEQTKRALDLQKDQVEAAKLAASQARHELVMRAEGLLG